MTENEDNGGDGGGLHQQQQKIKHGLDGGDEVRGGPSRGINAKFETLNLISFFFFSFLFFSFFLR